MLTKGQQFAMEFLQSGQNIFLSGEAGSGKSYVLNDFLETVKEKNIVVCAPTGIAAIRIGGATLHRTFKVPLEPISYGRKPRKASNSIQKAEIIVIDEISMCRFDVFQYVATAIKRAEETSGIKKQLIVVGDFFQLPPVLTERDYNFLKQTWGDIIEIGDGYAFQAPMWEEFNFKTILLTEVIRQKGEQDFIHHLNQIRHGDASSINWFNKNSAQKKQAGIYLCGTNREAEKINALRVAQLPGKERIYKAEIEGTVTASDKITSEQLVLKPGMQVMSLINGPEGRYQNGSIGMIRELKEDSVVVDFGGNTPVELGSNLWEVVEYELGRNQKIVKNIIGTFTQIPLRVAYALTIHKSQGQTYMSANISPVCFTAGQLYVALSRVRSMEHMYLTAPIKTESLITSFKVLQFYEQAIIAPLDNSIESVRNYSPEEENINM